MIPSMKSDTRRYPTFPRSWVRIRSHCGSMTGRWVRIWSWFGLIISHSVPNLKKKFQNFYLHNVVDGINWFSMSLQFRLNRESDEWSLVCWNQSFPEVTYQWYNAGTVGQNRLRIQTQRLGKHRKLPLCIYKLHTRPKITKFLFFFYDRDRM